MLLNLLSAIFSLSICRAVVFMFGAFLQGGKASAFFLFNKSNRNKTTSTYFARRQRSQSLLEKKDRWDVWPLQSSELGKARERRATRVFSTSSTAAHPARERTRVLEGQHPYAYPYISIHACTYTRAECLDVYVQTCVFTIGYV